MTHCAGYRACAVAHDRDVLTIGLDAEPHEPLPDGVLGAVACGDEQARLAALAIAAPGVSWDRVLFSAKESVYKAWFPLTRRWLGFEHVAVTIAPAAGTFTARLLVDGPEVNGAALTAFEGRWLIDAGLIITAIVRSRLIATLSRNIVQSERRRPQPTVRGPTECRRRRGERRGPCCEQRCPAGRRASPVPGCPRPPTGRRPPGRRPPAAAGSSPRRS